MGLSLKKKGETPKIDALLTYQISHSKPQNDPFGSVLGSTKNQKRPRPSHSLRPFCARLNSSVPSATMKKARKMIYNWIFYMELLVSRRVFKKWLQDVDTNPINGWVFSENRLETMVLTVRYIGGSCGFSPLTQRDKWLQHPRNISSPSH